MLPSARYSAATNSGSSAMPMPSNTVGIRASTLVTRNGPVGVTVSSSPAALLKRQTQRSVEALSDQVDHGIAQMQVDRHLRIEPEKGR